MTITTKKLPVDDYHQVMINQGRPFYEKLCKVNKDEFNEWLIDSSVLFDEVNSFAAVAPSPELSDEILNLGVTTAPSQCHYNSKAVALLKPEYECFTGFVFTDETISIDEFPGIYTHSFNVRDGKIVDFSRRESRDTVMKENPYFHHIYVYAGVRIPLDFIKRFEDEPSMNPLIAEWFIESKNPKSYSSPL